MFSYFKIKYRYFCIEFIYFTDLLDCDKLYLQEIKNQKVDGE